MDYIGILLKEDTGDLQIKNGKLVLGETIYQNLAVIIEMHQGESKASPMLGVGIGDYLNENEVYSLRHSIRENAKSDNVRLTTMNIDLQQGVIDIKAEKDV
jgi:hypothetical protein